jgi:hypothetical protein
MSYFDRPTFDARDGEILCKRAQAFIELEGPQVGDFVDFADGVTRRISYVWKLDDKVECQTTELSGGSYYLGEGYASFSGGLLPSVDAATFTLSFEQRAGRFWFFHHGFAGAHQGVECSANCRVWKCSLAGGNK